MRRITDVIRQFKLNRTDQLDREAIVAACRDARMSWIESLLNPVVTVQIFFLQILHGNTACEHLSHLARISFTAAAYCQARMRLKLAALYLLLERSVAALHQEALDHARWLGHRVFFVDGSSFSMPDTPTLQAHFGHPPRTARGVFRSRRWTRG